MLDEYSTSEQFEIVYLIHIGFPYEVDRTNPRKIVFIFKGDVDLIKAKLSDFWDGNTRVDALQYSNDLKGVKQMMWVGGKYDPNFYHKKTGSIDSASEAEKV